MYSTDGGSTWKTAKSAIGETSITIAKKTDATPTWMLSSNRRDATRYRIQQTAGNKNNPIYIDDITIYYTAKGFEVIRGDVNRDGKVNVTDVTALVNMILGSIDKDEESADVNGDGKINVSDVTALINIILGVTSSK